MADLTGLIGRFHPVLVHLPIGILLAAIAFEWLSVRKRYEALAQSLPLIWKAGAATALLSCASGWLLGRSGGYEAVLLDQHQYFGLATAACTTVLCFLPKRRVFSLLSGVLLVATGHLGGSLTHGAGYLLKADPAKETATTGAYPENNAAELPGVPVAPAAEKDIAALRRAGLSVTPLASGSPWLSVSFVNAEPASDSLFRLMENVAPQVSRLNLHGVAVPESGWKTLAKCRNLTRLNLSAGKVEDRHLAYLDSLTYLCQLNLSQTEVQLHDPAVLAKLPALRRLFLYKTAVSPAQWPRVFQFLPNAGIDTGGYRVPTLKTDTVLLTEKQKY